MVTCPHCGAERPWVACGVSHPIPGDCPNGCMKRERQRRIAESAAASKRIQDQQASCLHEWRTCVCENHMIEHCAICGAIRPAGGGSW